MEPIQDPLFEQMKNELRSLLQGLNKTYGDLFHCNLLTLVDMQEMRCDQCANDHKQCLRCVVGYNLNGKPNQPE